MWRLPFHQITVPYFGKRQPGWIKHRGERASIADPRYDRFGGPLAVVIDDLSDETADVDVIEGPVIVFRFRILAQCPNEPPSRPRNSGMISGSGQPLAR